jgi:hypothetical protein
MSKGSFVFMALFLSPALTLAVAPAPNCNPTRQAKAEVKVERLHWQQVNGNYKLQAELVCTNSLDVAVLPGIAAGCLYPILSKCDIVMDGTKHIVTVSGLISHNNSLGVPTKHFAASYYLDRNSGTETTGEAASSDVSTADLSLKRIGISVNSKLDGPSPGKPTQAFRDGLTITVNYGDIDAP